MPNDNPEKCPKCGARLDALLRTEARIKAEVAKLMDGRPTELAVFAARELARFQGIRITELKAEIAELEAIVVKLEELLKVTDDLGSEYADELERWDCDDDQVPAETLALESAVQKAADALASTREAAKAAKEQEDG